MNVWLRFGTFNLVSAGGMVLQLAALAVFNRLFPGHYLTATAAAIELALIHNFVWHLHTTWRDRRGRTGVMSQLMRFHLSNGLVSMAGNLAIMRLLVHGAHAPVLAANVAAILACSLVNFRMGDQWVFVARSGGVMQARSIILLALCAASPLSLAHTQSAATHPEPIKDQFNTDCAYANVFTGPSFSSRDRTAPSFTGGVTIGQYFARNLGKGFVPSPQFELGMAGPLPGGHPLDGLVSVNAMFANKIPRQHVYPFLSGGYTRIFATGNAVNFGLGVDLGKDEYRRLLRIEVHDYYLLSGPRQHVVGLRIGFGKFLAD